MTHACVELRGVKGQQHDHEGEARLRHVWHGLKLVSEEDRAHTRVAHKHHQKEQKEMKQIHGCSLQARCISTSDFRMTAILIIIEGRQTANNGFKNQFTTKKAVEEPETDPQLLWER